MSIHKPVLLKETIEGLHLKKGAVVADATAGGGGHTTAIAKAIGKTGTLVAIDVDKRSLKKLIDRLAKENDKGWAKVIPINENFAEIGSILKRNKIKETDAILADLGYSSDQIEDPSYGMSFSKDSRLDMRLDEKIQVSALDIVNGFSEKNLAVIFKRYGEERFSKRIVHAIAEARTEKPIETTKQLEEIIITAVPNSVRRQKIHPATKVFQALRIVVNDEVENLEKFLDVSIEKLKRGGRLAVISFHSGEDRIVKRKFREYARGCVCPKEFPVCRCGQKPRAVIVTKKPLIANQQEILANPRSRSAKLRIIEKI